MDGRRLVFRPYGRVDGTQNFAINCYDRPEFIHEAMWWTETRNQRGIQKVVRQVRPDFVLYNGDCAYKTGTMIAPEMIREFCHDPTKKTVDMIRDLDIPFAFHTDGKLDDVVPLLTELGICAVHGCEKQANDLGHLVETFGDDIVLCRNTDVVFLTHATAGEVVAETEAMLEAGSHRQRFVVGCNTSPLRLYPGRQLPGLLPGGRGVAAAGAPAPGLLTLTANNGKRCKPGYRAVVIARVVIASDFIAGDWSR